jgi:hypothetical protein
VSGIGIQQVEAVRPDRKVSGVWKGARHPGKAVLLWAHPRMVCSLQEDPDDDVMSKVRLILLDRKDPGW